MNHKQIFLSIISLLLVLITQSFSLSSFSNLALLNQADLLKKFKSKKKQEVSSKIHKSNFIY